MSERRNRATFQKPQLARIASKPGGETFPRKIRSPAKAAGYWLEKPFEDKSRTSLGTDSIKQNDFSARLQHPRKFIQRHFRVRYGVHYALRGHDIKGLIRKKQLLGIHYCQTLHVTKIQSADALTCFAQHSLGKIDAKDAVRAGVIRQRNASADPNLKNSSSNLLHGRNNCAPALLENPTEDQIVHRRPERINPLDSGFF